MADFDVNISDGTSIEVVVAPSSGTGAGVTDHGALTGLSDDDHAQYHNDARGDVRYYQKSEVYTKAEGDARYLQSVPGSYATDVEVAQAITDHEAEADPHPTYLTQPEGDARYLQSIPGSVATDTEVASAISDHEAASDPHTGYQKESEKGQVSGYASLDGGGTVPDAQIPSGVARDSEVSSAISTHEAASDPHTGYQKESEKDQNNGYAGLNSSGFVPISRIASGAPNGTKFVRDDGVLATPAGGGATLTKVYAQQDSATSLSTSVYTKVLFATTGEIDALSEWDAATGTFTAASTKRVHFDAIVSFNSNTGGYRVIRFYLNGAQTRFAVVVPPVNGDTTTAVLSAYLDLASGDTVDVRAITPGHTGTPTTTAALTSLTAHGVG